MIRLIFPVFLTILAASGLCYGQDCLPEQLAFAQSLYSGKEFNRAITELKRLKFFDSENLYAYQASLLIGDCYKNLSEFDEALRNYTIAGAFASEEAELYESAIRKVRINILRRTIPEALKLLEELSQDTALRSRKDEIIYWTGWAYIFHDDWLNASLQFAAVPQGSELAELCREVNNQKYSVSFARVISYIFPGAGQIYCGEYFSGLLSLGWNLLAGWLTIEAFTAERIFDGILLAEMMWLRFYRGNIENAGNFALRNNLILSNKALLYLQEQYKGLKP